MSSTGCADSNPIFESLRLNIQDNLTAHAGGGQATVRYQDPTTGAANSGALYPAAGGYRVAVFASNNDSVTLPPAVAGQIKLLANADASHSLNVFPAKGDAINSLGADAVFAMAAGKVVVFIATGAGQWHALLTA